MKWIETKLRMPVYSPVVQRGRLFSELECLKPASLISIIGDSGYGKTTLVASYIHEKKIPAVWYNLTVSDRYKHVFISYLKAGIMEKLHKKRPTANTSPESTEAEFEELLLLLTAQKEPLCIVLDDYQSVNQSPEIKAVMKELLAHCSPFIRFIIISRVRPNLSISRLKTEGKYKELTTDDIAFTLAETEEFFHSAHQLKLEPHELELIYKKTEGWIASYQLILGIISKMAAKERAQFWTQFPHVQDIYDYLSSEVFEAQSEEIKEFLCETSLLPELNPEIIDELLGRKDSKHILQQLQREHLFIASESEGTTRYHGLFREFLYQKYKERASSITLQEQQLKLAAIYESRYQFVYAFVYSVIGKDYPAAARLMELISHRYNPIESMVFLDGWLEEMTLEKNIANNTLFLIRCVPLSIIQQLIAQFEKNMALLKEKNNKLWLCSLQHRLATIFLMHGDLMKAKQLFLESLQESERFQDRPMTALNLNLLAEIQRYFGEYKEALQNVRRSLFISEKYGHKHTQLHALDTIATICLDEGKLDEADLHIQQALTIAKKYDRSSLFFIYTTMGRMLRMRGDLNGAIKWGKKAVDISEEYNINFDIGWSNRELGLSYIEGKQWQQAENCLMEASRAFELFAYYRCTVIKSQIELYRQKNDRVREKQKITEFVQLCKEHNFYWEEAGIKAVEGVIIKEKQKVPLEIQTLGPLKIFYKGQPVIIKRKSSLRLLQFLVTNRNKKIEKDILLDALFPNGSLESVQNQLHVTVSTLRKALEPPLKKGGHSRFISRSDNHYLFHTTEIDLDIERFCQLASAGREANSPVNIKKLLAAEALYRGDYLEEYPYEHYVEAERENMRSLFMKICRTLAQYYEQQEEYEKCFTYFEKLIKKDPYQEEVYFDYIKLLLRQNMTTEANRLARQLVIHVEEEMGIDIRGRMHRLFSTFNRVPVF
ncbi:tetratricopeptide repeat protein [Pseudobacillus sp. FSL P4-0506]|uniref:tetratricopeptide repeat protein n=1 Tax=unclassified Pseudobacillus TaxID=2619284 RepID=UPI0030FA143E